MERTARGSLFRGLSCLGEKLNFRPISHPAQPTIWLQPPTSARHAAHFHCASQTFPSRKRNDFEDPGIVDVKCSGLLGPNKWKPYPSPRSARALFQDQLDLTEDQFHDRNALAGGAAFQVPIDGIWNVDARTHVFTLPYFCQETELVLFLRAKYDVGFPSPEEFGPLCTSENAAANISRGFPRSS
jgi:hypothetical protein